MEMEKDSDVVLHCYVSQHAYFVCNVTTIMNLLDT